MDKTEVPGRFVFEKYFKINNLSLYQPKKDQCNLCIQHENGNFSHEAWQQHVPIKEKIRQEKHYDKEKTKRNELIIISLDLQAVKQLHT